MFFRSLAKIIIALSALFGVLPLLAIKLNDRYALPVYEFDYSGAVGLLLAALGGVIVAHCAQTLFFKPGQDVPSPIFAPEKFIVEGLYRFVRNPMYLGYFAIILAEFFFFGHFLLLLYLILVVIFIHLLVVFKEEKALENKFGEHYREYKRKVPRWLPRL